MDLATFRLDATRRPAVGTLNMNVLIGSDVTSSSGLNHPTEMLTDFMSRNFDLVVVRRPWTLLGSLQLGSDLRGLLQQIGEFLF